MSKRFVKPYTERVRALLAMIFGDELEANECDVPDFSNKYVATFVDDEDKLVALCICDQQFTTYSGAALAMIPSNIADEMIAENDLSKTLSDNFYEVMNICSKLLMSDESEHLRLDKTLVGAPGDEAIAALGEDAIKCGFEVDIPRYGKGIMSFLMT